MHVSRLSRSSDGWKGLQFFYYFTFDYDRERYTVTYPGYPELYQPGGTVHKAKGKSEPFFLRSAGALLLLSYTVHWTASVPSLTGWAVKRGNQVVANDDSCSPLGQSVPWGVERTDG